MIMRNLSVHPELPENVFTAIYVFNEDCQQFLRQYKMYTPLEKVDATKLS